MNDDPDISTFKANKATDKRHYIGFEFKVLKKMQPNDLTSTLQGSLTNGYAVLGVDPSEGDVESTLKKLDAKKLLIVSIPYVKDIEKSQDKITALKADLIVLETHMKKPTGDGPLAPSVWVTAPTGVSATATFADVKATLQKLQDGKVHFSISASVAVFEYTSTVAVDAANLFTQTMTGSEGQALFEETGCEQRIEETNHNIAVVEDKTKMKLQVYENDATLKAKVDAATATPTDVPGWTLFDVMCKKSPTPSECPMRYENPVDVIKTKDDWTKTPSGGTPTVVEAPNIPIFCVVKPDTSCTATTAMSFSNCDGVMYYDPAWDMASDPTDALYAAVHTKAANDDKYYIGVSYGKLDLDKIPVDFKSIALMDIDSETTTATDVNTKLTDAKVQSLKRAVGIIGEKELDKWMADTEKGVYIILQTITKPPTTPCQVMPTSPWKADLTKAAATITSRKGVALSLTLEGITYTITTPSATDAAAVADEVLNSATLTACTAAVDADMSNNCASSADNTDKDNSVSLDTAKTAATVFESKDSITAKKTIWKTPWAVFWTACKARSTDCQAVDDLVKVLK
ncbi:uncharacterized protein LOC135401106 [Ornithodoros turicata]|uniref:uncharacterized protein LOC135401106 n=1 Tax=Ornithodoros turicata TaxID=34597 RepID=UPI003138F18C